MTGEKRSASPDKDEAAKHQKVDKESTPSEHQQSTEQSFTIQTRKADLFAAPSNSILLHSCNCQGSWSKGVAAKFKQLYPKAFQVYREHCQNNGAESIIGTTLLIRSESDQPAVGCLFTSRWYGLRKDKPATILDQTEQAMKDLVKQLDIQKSSRPKSIWMPQINSGLFGVPWSDTEALLKKLRFQDLKCELPVIVVVSR